MRSASKQDQLQPRCHSEARSLSQKLWNGLLRRIIWKAVVKLKPEKKLGLNGIRTHDLCDVCSALPVQCPINWERTVMHTQFSRKKIFIAHESCTKTSRQHQITHFLQNSSKPLVNGVGKCLPKFPFSRVFAQPRAPGVQGCTSEKKALGARLSFTPTVCWCKGSYSFRRQASACNV